MAANRPRRAAQTASRLWSSGATAARTGFDFWAMAAASLTVIGYRTPIIAQALSAPAEADHRELRRMSEEKLDAALASGTALARGWTAWQRTAVDALLDQTRFAVEYAGAAALAPNARQATLQRHYAQRSLGHGMATALRLGELALRMSATVLDPVHGHATRNARRLARTAARVEQAT